MVEQADKVVFEGEPTAAQQDILKQMSEEDTPLENVVVVDEPNESNVVVEEPTTPAPAAEQDEKPEPEENAETEPKTPVEEKAEEAKPSGTVTLTIDGEEKEFTHNHLRAGLGRQKALQKQIEKLSSSDEQRLGILLKAAEKGDLGAIKKVQALLVKSSGSDNSDDLDEKLSAEGIEDFDENEVVEAKKQDAEFDNIFLDVKESVDFQTNMDMIETDIKGRMPEKVYQKYWNDPVTRRTMYDLAASGKTESLFEAFEAKLSELPFEKRLEVKKDSESYGLAFVEVINEQNALAAKAKTGDSDQLENVSSGSSASEAQANADDGPDVSEMTDEEFRKHAEKVNGIVYD